MQAYGKACYTNDISSFKVSLMVYLDAILGIRELFEDYPDALMSSLSTILSNCARIIGDEVSSVT